jgi:hypothetical protein
MQIFFLPCRLFTGDFAPGFSPSTPSASGRGGLQVAVFSPCAAVRTLAVPRVGRLSSAWPPLSNFRVARHRQLCLKGLSIMPDQSSNPRE